MNAYNIWIKYGESNSYSNYSQYAVFPFNFSYLLDEKLNEAYVTLVGCPVSLFEPLTEIRIDLIQNSGETSETTQSIYFVVANDNAFEQPNGSGKYKHQLYLIERTKILEGIICDSITFTNTSGNIYAD